MRRKRIVGLLFDVGDLSEDADESMPVHQYAGADVDLNATTVSVDEDHLRIGHCGRADNLGAKCSRARRVSSGATTDVNWRPRTSPTRRRAAGLIQRMTPVGSMT